MNKVLIMGGNGFIGQNISTYFDQKGIDFDIYDISYKEGKHHCYQGNILTDDNLNDIIADYDSIIYLITSVSPKKSMDFPEQSYTQDIPMLLRVLDCCVANGKTKRVIFSSSGGTVYGECLGKSLKEDENIEFPINHYAICKLSCEKILMLYNKLYGMENIILRIANPYGIGQNPLSGVGAITTFTSKILAGEEITIYGDGTTIRDYINIDKVAEAFYQSVLYEFNPNISPVFNVGSGEEIDLNSIISIISETLEITPTIHYLPARNFDVKKNVLNMEKTSKYLNITHDVPETEKIKEYVNILKIKRK